VAGHLRVLGECMYGTACGPVSCCQLVLGIKRIVMVVSQWEVAIWTQSIVFFGPCYAKEMSCRCRFQTLVILVVEAYGPKDIILKKRATECG
jgi:hypothetical protein